jgi:hypothetical protein
MMLVGRISLNSTLVCNGKKTGLLLHHQSNEQPVDCLYSGPVPPFNFYLLPEKQSGCLQSIFLTINQ